ncbi:MAG UNVERIFIED_CONTAM: hypothetical protein LVR29_19820 [Microcystis novacekii LVE1205-3]
MNVSGGTLASDFTQADGNSYTAIFTADDAGGNHSARCPWQPIATVTPPVTMV